MLKISLRTYILFFLLLSAVVIALSFRFSQTNTFKPSTDNVVEEKILGVNIRRFDDNGRLFQVASMKEWIHHQGQSNADMIAPMLTIYQPDGSAWQIQAKHGQGFYKQIHGHLEKLHLTDDVVVERLSQQHDVFLTLKTEQIIYVPDQYSASTTAPVTVTGKGIHLQAKGMQAFLDKQQVKFLHEVKSLYVHTK